MTYIYLNHYPNGYLYVGSHTWDGDGLDPNYKGSSGLAKRHGWVPDSIEILEVVSEDRKFVAEREWIEKYCTEYGIADCAKGWSKLKRWVSQYNSGCMLNMHSNSAYAVQPIAVEKARDPLVRKKANDTWRKNGCKGHEKTVAAAHIPEAIKKQHEHLRSHAYQYEIDGIIGSSGVLAEYFKVPYTTMSCICSKARIKGTYSPTKGTFKGKLISYINNA